MRNWHAQTGFPHPSTGCGAKGCRARRCAGTKVALGRKEKFIEKRGDDIHGGTGSELWCAQGSYLATISFLIPFGIHLHCNVSCTVTIAEKDPS